MRYSAHAQVVADFTANQLSGCSPLTVQFTDKSTGGATSYNWNLGNSNNSILQNPSATYVNPGTYTVSLTATGPGGSDVETKTAYITVYANPQADFTVNNTTGCAPLNVTFTDKSVKGTGTINQWTWDFNDGGTAVTRNPTHSFATNGSYTITLIVNDDRGCQNSIQKPALINVATPHNATFSQSGNFSCKPPFAVSFTSVVTPPNPSYTYEWDFGDGQTSSQISPSKTFSTGGRFDVTLKVTSPGGCVSKVTQQGAVFIPDPRPDFSISATSGCAPLKINVINLSKPDTSIARYTWATSNGLTDNSKNASFEFTNPGTYDITLTSTVGGCTESITKTNAINVSPGPDAKFTPTQSNSCTVPFTVQFNNFSTDATTYEWDFGNGQTSSQITPPPVTYTQKGKYTVKLTARNGTTCVKTTFGNVTISDPGFILKEQHSKQGCKPFTAYFVAKDTSAVPITSWTWTWKGNTIGLSDSFAFVFPDTGVHVVKVTGRTASGCIVEKYDTVKVGVIPKVDFSADKRFGCYGTIGLIEFTPTILPGSVIPTKYHWSFGDKDGQSDHRNPIRKYTDTGRFDVTLTVGRYGCDTTITKSDYIHIYPPIADFDAPTVFCSGDTLSFIDKSKGGNKFLWDFGNGNTSDLRSPRYKYPQPGNYRITLIVWDTIYNCSDTARKNIVIPATANIKFTQSDSAGCPGLQITFTDQSTVGAPYSIISRTFTFGDGQSSTASSTQMTFVKQGYLSVTLSVRDNRGCNYVVKKDSAIWIYRGDPVFNVTPKAACLPMYALAKDSSTSDFPIATRNFKWTDTDSTVTAADTAGFYYNTPLTDQSLGFNINLVITNTKGCTYTTSKNINYSKAIAAITDKHFKTCGSDSVVFSPGNTPFYGRPGFNYRWNFPSSGSSSSTEKTWKKFNEPDTTLPVQLTITDANGCKDSLTKMIRINNLPPKIGLYATPNEVKCYSLRPLIRFVDTTVAGGSGIASWKWKFGNDGTSILKEPQRVFPKPGKYSISLAIKDSAGCEDSITLPDYVVIGGPYGTYSFTPRAGCRPHEVSFTVNSGNAMLYIWDHADGNVDTFQVDTHRYQYQRAGIYYPRLTLVDSSGTCAFGYDAIDSIEVYELPKPDFTLDRSVICKGQNIVFGNATASKGKITSWQWFIGDDTSSVEGPLVMRFDSSGLFAVKLIASDTNGCVDSLMKDSFITVIDDTIPPAVPSIYRATVDGNTQVSFEFKPNTETDFSHYSVYFDYAGQIPTSTRSINRLDTIFIQTGINTLENPYSYMLRSVDVCNNVSDTSYKHTTVELKATAVTNAIRLNWTPYAGFNITDKYEIWKNDPLESANFTKIAEVGADTLQYLDTNIVCHRLFNYRIKTIELGGNEQISWSDTSGAIPLYAPTMPGTENIRATVVNDRHILLEWHKRTHKIPFIYAIYRLRDDESTPVLIAETNDTFLVDMNVVVDAHSYTYLTYLKDNCGGLSPQSNMAKTMLLKVDLEQNEILKFDPVLNWTHYQDWASGVSKYRVQFYYDSSKTYFDIAQNPPTDTSATHHYVNLEQRDYCYRIIAYQQGNEQIWSESNYDCISTAPRLFAPTAFTVTGDNLNETFDLKGVFLDQFNLKIYNRWGELMFETNDINKNWDGTFKGEPCKSDVYVYQAEGIGRKGQRISIKGNVTLLR